MVTRSRCFLAAMLAFLLAASPVAAFKPGIHKDISRDAMRTITTTVDGSRTITFTDKAIEEVRKANWRTDIGLGFFRGENHFTEELFSASSQRLIDLTVDLRAERSGTGDGRVYMVEVECTDGAGNRASAAVAVTVPHNQ